MNLKTNNELIDLLHRWYDLMDAGDTSEALQELKDLLLHQSKIFKNIGGCCGGCK